MRGLLQELRYNPNWRLQPRVLNGSEAGQWTDGFASGTGQQTPSLLVAAKTKDFNYACKALKLDRHRASDVLHDIKLWWQIPNDADCTFDTNTGDIIFDGRVVGNLRG